MSRVVLEYITKNFRGPNGQTIRAVNGASLTVENKELLTLVGPSGCGKTTTLRLIAGLEELTGGTIMMDGNEMNGILPKDRDVAMVFQNHALFPHLLAYDNVVFGLKLRRISKTEITRRADEMTELLGLRDCLARKPAELSGGQRQRVALARALVRRPKLLLLDEPLSNLDAPLRRELRRELRRLHQELALTIIHVTHDQVEALALGQRVAVMNRGVIEQVGSPAEVRSQPATPFVAAFLDTNPFSQASG
jgi:multiple sugar transport system ATP-binding protein